MRQLTTLCLVAVPLIAGCAGGSLDREAISSAAESNAQSIADVRSQLKRMQVRLRKLRRGLKKHSHAGAATPSQYDRQYDPSEITNLAAAVADLQNKFRSLGPATAPSAELQKLDQRLATLEQERQGAAPQPSTQPAPDVSNQIRALQLAITRIENAQKSADEKFSQLEDSLDKDRTSVTENIIQLNDKLRKIEAAQQDKPATAAPPAGPELKKLQDTQTETAAKIKEMADRLAADRVLLIEELTSLNERLEKLESAKPSQPAQP